MSPRLDAALAERGLARSRTHAATLIADGLVSVDGRVVVKSSTPVGPDADLVSALEVIEDQPLAARSAAYEALAESLARQLDSGPTSHRP